VEISVVEVNARVPVTVFSLKGDLSSEEPLVSQAQQAHQGGVRFLLLDLKKVPYISSAGLRGIHQVYNLLRGSVSDEGEKQVRQGIIDGTYKSPNLKILNPSKNAKKALSLAGYDMFLEIFKKETDAVASFE